MCLSRLEDDSVEDCGRLFRGEGPEWPVSWLRLASEGEAVERFPICWADAVREIEAAGGTRLLVCGNRGVGKSTLFRHLANRFLSSHSTVCLVDTDPGQAELDSPGTVSIWTTSAFLLSPGFCAGKYDSAKMTPLLRIAVPGVSSDRDTDFFSRSVARLAALVPPGMPVVINTPGWITGFGLETLVATASVFKPSAAFQIHDPQSHIAATVSLGEATTAYPLIGCGGGGVVVPLSLPAVLLRDIGMKRRLGVGLAVSLAAPLVKVALSRICIAIHNGEKIPDELVLHAIVKTVVALVRSKSFVWREGTVLRDSSRRRRVGLHGRSGGCVFGWRGEFGSAMRGECRAARFCERCGASFSRMAVGFDD